MLEALIEPISDENPCGEYLKDNRSVYRGYRNAFNVAQSSFRRLIEDPDAINDNDLVLANVENWNTLSSECSNCLQNLSKDIEILSWHAVSQLFTKEPFENLANSLATFDYIVTHFWGQLNPMAPEGKLKGDTDAEKQKEWAEGKIKPLLQLVGDTAESGLLYMPLQMQTLIDEIDYTQYFAAEKNGTLSQLKESALKVLPSEMSEVTERILSLGKIHDSLVNIESTIATQCREVGAQGVSFRFVKTIVERIINAMKYLLADGFSRWPLDPEEVQEVEEVAETNTVSEDNNSADATQQASMLTNSVGGVQTQAFAFDANNAVMNRDQAFMELQRIADYFLETEPHSPVYLLLKRAIRWGGMSLSELMDELVGDDASVHSRISQLSGMESAEHVSSIKVEKRAIRPATDVPSVQTTSTGNTNIVEQKMNEPAAAPVEAVQKESEVDSNSQPEKENKVSSFEW